MRTSAISRSQTAATSAVAIGMPVATAEVAAVCDREIADVRADLARFATFLPVGGDGYWTAAA